MKVLITVASWWGEEGSLCGGSLQSAYIPNTDWFNVQVGNLRLCLTRDEFVILK